MGRKKDLHGTSHTAQSFELKPFCYYCDKEFDTVKVLIQHQRTKHLACSECGSKFDTVTGLRVHMLNAYKKTIKEVTGAIPGRSNPDIVVCGMEGIPKAIIEEKTRKAKADLAEKEKARADRERAERPAAPPEPPAAATPSSPPRLSPDESSSRQPKVTAEPSTPLAAPPHAVAAPGSGVSSRALSTPAPVQTRSVAAQQQPQTQPQQPAAAPQWGMMAAAPQGGMMAGLSPAVQKLLAGASSPADGDTAVLVPALPGRTVPGALSGLHPVALQVLASAGILPSGVSNGGGAPPQALAEKRPAPIPVANAFASSPGGLGMPSMLPTSAFPPVGFQVPVLGHLGSPLAPTFSGAIGMQSVQVSAEAKRPRLEGQGLITP